jgi:GT2 family glycosyltransferase/glycosyltransferase involved in cell wall biosynthesis
MQKNVTVIIPIYNAFEDTVNCINSVLKHSEPNTKILAIDDCSSAGSFLEYSKDKIVADNRLSILKNGTNLGFVGTCNFGMEQSKPDDVILLNSDTIVTKNWISKLRRVAYNSDRVASVTPLSNNAVICSVPNFCVPNEIPLGYNIDEFAELVESVSKSNNVQLPSCMGFCVYLKRMALDQVGYLDPIYGLGYGEENDLSQRFIANNLINVCDDSTYIYHKGNCSFLGLQESLSKTNWRILCDRYPHYADDVSRFCSSNPLKSSQELIQYEIINRASQDKPNILHILHNGPFVAKRDALGGTERHVQELINHNINFVNWSLVRHTNYYYLAVHLKGFTKEFILPARAGLLLDLLKPEHFQLIHLHHNRWFDYSELTQALIAHGNYNISCHDYNLVCPRFHMLKPDFIHCNGNECTSHCGFKEYDINSIRSNSIKLLEKANKIFYFSDSSKNTITKILTNTSNWQKVPHGTNSTFAKNSIINNSKIERDVFKIAFLGHIPRHKGLEFIEKLAKHKNISNKTIEWHIFGKHFSTDKLDLIEHGEYNSENLPELLNKEKIDLVCILSICPETFSITLSEAWQAGIPALVTPIGALEERVRETEAGWIADNLTYQSILDKIQNIILDPTDYQIKLKNAMSITTFNIKEEINSYLSEYNREATNYINNNILLVKYLNNIKVDITPSVYNVLLGQIINKIIYILDMLRVRERIQTILIKLLPSKLIYKLKSIRI